MLSVIGISRETSDRMRQVAFLSAIMVVIIHCVGVYCSSSVIAWRLIRDGVCRAAVPAFFLMSGFFLAGSCSREGWWMMSVRKRLVTLGVPYLIWNLLFFAFHNVRAFISHEFSLSISNVAAALGLNPLDYPAYGPLWYVRAVFILVFVSPVLIFIIRRARWIAILFLFMVFGAYGMLGPWEGHEGKFVFFFRKFFALQGLFYFSAGIALRFGVVSVRISHRASIASLLVAAGLLVAKVIAQEMGMGWYGYCGYAAVPFLLLAIFNLMPGDLFPSWMAGLSFPLYLVHVFVVNTVLFALNAIRHGNGMQSCGLLMTVVLTVLTFFISLAIVVGIRRFCPKAVNCLLWGGR